MVFNPFTETPVASYMTNSGTGYAHQMLDIIEVSGRLYVGGYYPSSYNGVTNYVYGISRLYMDLTKDF